MKRLLQKKSNNQDIINPINNTNYSEDFPVIVDNIWKSFKIPLERRIKLHEHISSFILRKNRGYNYLHVLKGISFKVKKGETLGIIGPNGSGKSTLLKILNGIFPPDKGTIKIRGKVGALIEVGAGFHPMLTGRENIYINGTILGMSKKEIDEKFDKIVDFADIGDFLDVPVKNYSSGMYVRLGFSIAVCCQPEILLIDEVLSVGDISFRKKCLQKIIDLKKNKEISIIFVSL